MTTTPERNLETLRQKLAASRQFSGRVDEIINRVTGKEHVRAGMSVEVERSADKVAPNGESFHVKIKASTDGIARDGGIITMDAWANGGLVHFNANPVILAFHSHRDPIGISVHTMLERSFMTQYWRFHEETEVSRTMKKLYEGGYMRAASVGFLIREFKFIDELSEAELDGLIAKHGSSIVRDAYWVATRAELLETSAVPVPADPGALQFQDATRSAQAVGIDVSSLIAEAKRMETKVETVEPTVVVDSSRTTDESNKEVVELRGLVEAMQNEIVELRESLDKTREQVEALQTRTTTTVEPTATSGNDKPDNGERSGDKVQLKLEVRNGESEDDALNRLIDERARSLVGAPIPHK